MAISTSTMRGITRFFAGTKREGLATPRLVVYPPDTTPELESLYIRPTEVPSGTLVEGCMWWDDDNHTLAAYDGSTNVEFLTTGSASFTDLTITDDLVVGDDITLSSTGALLTFGTSDPVIITHSANTITLAAGDTLAAPTITCTGVLTGDDVTVVDDLTVGDDLTLSSDGAIISIGATPFVFTHSANTLTISAGDTLTGPAIQTTATARTATADGLTTGIIADGTSFVTVTSSDANHIIVLPTPTVGTVVRLANGATGYELRSSAPATVAINGGTGADVESAIAATQLVECRCRTATAWICNQYGTDGTESKVEAAA